MVTVNPNCHGIDTITDTAVITEGNPENFYRLYFDFFFFFFSTNNGWFRFCAGGCQGDCGLLLFVFVCFALCHCCIRDGR